MLAGLLFSEIFTYYMNINNRNKIGKPIIEEVMNNQQ